MKRCAGLIFATLLLFSFSIKAQQKILGTCLEGYDYPYPVQYITLHLQHETLKMAYMDVPAEHPNGHVLLLLHGKNFNGAYWGPTIKVLAENGYRVVVPDQIGFGKSSKPHMIQYSFQLLAGNTRSLLDSLRIEKLSVLGHSMGGMLATRFVLMYPTMIEKFILEDPIGLEDWKLKVPYQSIDTWYKKELAANYAYYKKYEQENYYHGDWQPAYDEWLNLLAYWTGSPDYNRVAWNAALTDDMVFTQPVCYEFGQIQAPTLLIIGQLDKTAIGKDLVSEDVRKTMGNYPELGRETQQKIQRSKLVELQGTGHIPHVESFDDFIHPVLNFLKQ
jgi:pimeloyl-ACP methyl ester carboxylesterase